MKPMRRFAALALTLSAFSFFIGCEGADDDDVVLPPKPEREVIATDNAPAAIGPYSQAIRYGDMLFLAGQIGIDPSTGKLVEGGVGAETARALDNLGAVLDAAGFSFANVVQAQVFLADLNDYSAMNSVYAEYFTDGPPARAAVQVARVPRDARVEIMLTAAR